MTCCQANPLTQTSTRTLNACLVCSRSRPFRIALFLAIALGCSTSRVAVAQKQPDVLQALQDTLVKVIERVEPSVVAIGRQPAQLANAAVEADRRQQLLRRQFQPGELRAIQGLNWDADDVQFFGGTPGGLSSNSRRVTGAGVVLDKSGLVITQYLVVKPGWAHFISTTDGKTYPADIVGADPRSGLAVLKARTKNLKAVEIGAAEQLRKGHLVIAIGNPFAIASDGEPTVSYGMVSNLARKAPALENLNNVEDPDPNSPQRFRSTIHHYGTLIQTDARLGWNASGGALVTLDGKLVGVTTTVAAIAGHEKPAGYAIPINKTMRRVIETLKQGKEVEYGLLGVRFDQQAIRPLESGGLGIGVNHVNLASAAERAGLRALDIIAEINGQPTNTPEALQLAVGSLAPGDERPLVFERSGRRFETSVKLDKIYVPGKKVITNRPPAWQGIHVDYATALEESRLDEAADQGLIDKLGCVAVVQVNEGSPAWKNGVRAGMFISHVTGQRVSSPEEFRKAVRAAKHSVKLRFTPGNSPESAKPVEPPRS